MKTQSIIKAVLAVFANFVLAAMFIGVVNTALNFEIPVAKVASIITAISFAIQTLLPFLGFKSVKGFAFFALQTEVWSQDIQDNLYQQNPFMNFAKDYSMWINNKTVHVPQAGAVPTVVKNRSVFPGTIGNRVDTDLTFDMANYTVDPIHMTNLEELQINYNKRMSIMSNFYNQLGEVVANNTLYSWAPAGSTRIVSTTGANSSLALPHSTATGTRKAITLADIASAKAKLDKDNVPANGRILLMPSDMYNSELLAIANIQQYYAYNSETLKTGVAGTIFGFQIMVRPNVLVYDNSNVIKAVSDDGTVTTPSTTDFSACIAYHPDYVVKALGAINSYYDAGSTGQGKPEYYGALFSAEVNHGAAKLRTDQKGVVAIVQAA